jgi:hypothetical protein
VANKKRGQEIFGSLQRRGEPAERLATVRAPLDSTLERRPGRDCLEHPGGDCFPEEKKAAGISSREYGLGLCERAGNIHILLRLTFYLVKDYKVAVPQALSVSRVGFALVVFRQHPETWMGG